MKIFNEINRNTIFSFTWANNYGNIRGKEQPDRSWLPKNATGGQEYVKWRGKKCHCVKRFSLISPILNGQVNNRKDYYAQISSKPVEMPHYGIRKYSPKTIESWYCDYMRGGLDALKPGYRKDR